MPKKVTFTMVRLAAIILLANISTSLAQGISAELTKKVEKPRTARIMFYNCENLFDYLDDTLKNDEEFLPEGSRYWTKGKYYDKLNNIAKVITAIGGWSAPELVGLCEVENKKVLHDLTENSVLYKFEYKIIHKESGDNRGIDVALLYKPTCYTPIKNQFIVIKFPTDPAKLTRDILYSKGFINKTDTVHIFVNHWPSRMGGQLESEEYRFFVASVLKTKTDSIFASNANANIIVMGDFNDEPTNKSITTVLKVQNSINKNTPEQLYNLNTLSGIFTDIGTHKYKGDWAVLDQFFISGNLFSEKNKLFTSPNAFTLFNADFLLENDETHLGVKPNRTFVGFKYHGGYSDHLPIFFDLNRE